MFPKTCFENVFRLSVKEGEEGVRRRVKWSVQRSERHIAQLQQGLVSQPKFLLFWLVPSVRCTCADHVSTGIYVRSRVRVGASCEKNMEKTFVKKKVFSFLLFAFSVVKTIATGAKLVVRVVNHD